MREDELSAEQNVKFIIPTFDVVGKELKNDIGFIGDNSSVYLKIASDTGIYSLGCVSRNFNLAVEAWINENSDAMYALVTVRNMMTGLGTLINVARLHRFAHISPVDPNCTR